MNNQNNFSIGSVLSGYFVRVILILLFILAMFQQSSRSQSTLIILRDKVNNQPVEFANIVARSLQDQTQEKTISDEKGMATFLLEPPFVIMVSCIGYQLQPDTVKSKGESVIELSPEYYHLGNVVITGQFRPQPIDKSIYQIDVIDQKQIRLKSANNLGDLFKTELGFQYRTEGIFGDFLRIRGLSGEHIKILMDGMPLTGRVADKIDLAQINLMNVDHIEIIEGPMSVIYGSNALAGAINIITSDYAGEKFSASANSYYETVGIYNFDAAFSKKIQNNILAFNVARNFNSGWGPVDTSRYKVWKPKLQYYAGASYRYKKGNSKFRYTTDFMNEELRDLDSLSLANLYEKALDSYHYTTRWNNSIDFINSYFENFVLNLQAGYSYYGKRKITYLNDLVNLEKTLAENPELFDTTRFHLVTTRGFVSNIPGKKYEYQTGFDLSYENALGKRTQGAKEITDLAGFMNLVYKPFGVLSIQPGIRIIYNSKYKTPVIYAFNVKYNPGSFTFRGSYGKGFTAPSLKQLYLQFIDNIHEIYGNPYLKPETANNFSLSGNYHFSKGKHSVQTEISLFYNEIYNAIQLAVDTTRFGWGKYFNIEGEAYKTKGLEANLTYNFFPRLTVTSGFITTGYSNFDDRNKFEYSTDIVSSIRYHSPRYKYEFAIFYKYTDKFIEFAGNYNSDGNLNGMAQRYIDSYQTMDITLSKTLFNDKLTLSGGVKNMFDITFVNSAGNLNFHGSSSNSTPAGYGRTYFIKLSLQIDKY